MAFLVFRRPKMVEKKDAVLILAVEFKSEEKSSLSLLEKKLAIFVQMSFTKFWDLEGYLCDLWQI